MFESKSTDSKFMIFVRDHFSEIVMIISLIIFFLTAVYTFSVYKTESINLSVDPIQTLEEGWEISETENEDGTHTLIFKNTIPYGIEEHTAIAFKSTDEVLYIYIDGNLEYQYGIENNFKKPINLGSHYVLLTLPEGSAGKEIKISATYPGKQTDWRQEREFLVEGNDGIILRLIRNDLISIIICFVMTLVSLFEIFKSFYLGLRRQPFRATLYLGLFILASSNWLASETILMQLLFKNAYVKYIIAYFSFLTLPCLFPMFAKEKLKRFNLPMAFVSVMSWTYATISMLIYIFASIGFEKHLYFAHGLMGSVVAVVLVCCILDRKNKQLKNLLAGTVILAFFAIVSLISYHHGYIHSFFSAYHFRDFFFAGMISFIAILLYDSYVQSSKDKQDAAMSNFYKQSAYTDLLTGLGSRTAFTEDFDRVESEKDKYKDITVIMLDLNNLKKINDVEGHAVGDRLIKGLASALKTAFGHIGKIYRVGGDEFVVLLTDLPDGDVDSHINVLFSNIDSQQNSDLTSDSVAVGYARRTKEINPEADIHFLFNLADERMYEDKKAKKKEKIDGEVR